MYLCWGKPESEQEGQSTNRVPEQRGRLSRFSTTLFERVEEAAERGECDIPCLQDPLLSLLDALLKSRPVDWRRAGVEQWRLLSNNE